MSYRLGVVVLGIVLFGCSSDDPEDTNSGVGGSGGTSQDAGFDEGGQGEASTDAAGAGGAAGSAGAAGAAGSAGSAGDGAAPGSYGELTSVDFNTAFLFDIEKVHSGVAGYLTNHPEGIQPGPAFSGYYKSEAIEIPSKGQTMVLGMHEPSVPNVIVMQQTIVNNKTASPLIQLVFPSDEIEEGSISVGREQDGHAVLTLLDVDDEQTPCLAAIGVGTLLVTSAVNTEALEGGSLAFTSDSIKLYHPSETPFGDMEEELSSTMLVCSKD